MTDGARLSPYNLASDGQKQGTRGWQTRVGNHQLSTIGLVGQAKSIQADPFPMALTRRFFAKPAATLSGSLRRTVASELPHEHLHLRRRNGGIM